MNTARLKDTLTTIYNKESRNYGDALHIVTVLEDEGIFALTTDKAHVNADHALAALVRRTKDAELKDMAVKLRGTLAAEFSPRP